MSADRCTFDIRDGRNRYKPCPRCGATLGMGLTSTTSGIAVECSECGFRGPEFGVDDGWTPAIDKDELMMALAWMQGKIKTTDVNYAVTGRVTGSGATHYRLARALKFAFDIGVIKM